MSTLLGNYVTPVPAQQRVGPHWFAGSADAIYQSLNLIHDERPDYRRRLRRGPRLPDGLRPDGRRRTSSPAAVLTVAGDPPADRPGRPVRRHRGGGRRPRGSSAFREKPKDALRACRTRPTRSTPRWATTSSTPTRWSSAVTRDAERRGLASTTWAATSCPTSSPRGEADVYDFRDNDVPGTTDRDRDYWRDVGTLDSYFEAHMDLDLGPSGLQPLQLRVADLHRDRPVAAGEVRARLAGAARAAVDSMVSPGCVVSGRAGRELGASRPTCRCTPGRTSSDAVLMDDVDIGRHAVVRRRDPRQERRRRPRAPGSGWTPRRTAPVGST